VQSRSSADSQYNVVLSQDGSYSSEAFNLLQKTLLDLSANDHPCREFIVNFGQPQVSGCKTIENWQIEKSGSFINIDMQNCQGPDGQYYRDFALENCIDDSITKAKVNIGTFYQAYDAGYAQARANDLATAAWAGIGVALMIGLYAWFQYRKKPPAHALEAQATFYSTVQAIERPRAETEGVRYRAVSTGEGLPHLNV
jgi:hypothetical protein